MDSSLSNIVAFASLFISGIIGLLSLRKMFSEARGADAGATKSYAEASKIMADQNLTLVKRVETLEAEVKELQDKLEGVEEQRDALMDWAERLVKWGKQYAPRNEPIPQYHMK